MSAPPGARRFLITGAAGFIGRHLTLALVERFGAASVTVLIAPRRRATEDAAVAALRASGVAIIEADLLALRPGSPPAPACDVVFHLAAAAEPENPRADFSVNDVGTRRLLEWLGPALRGARLVFASTLACVDRVRPRGVITEETPCTPGTPYGRTKLRAEDEIRARRAEFGYDFTVLRLCTIIGRGFRPTGMFGLCPQLLARGAWSARLNWPGRSSFLAMPDLVRLLVDTSAHPGAANALFVLGNGENPTFDAVLQQIADLHGLPRRRIVLPRLLWRLLAAVAWPLSRSPLLPARWRVPFWRAANVIDDGICADATRLNQLLGCRYQSVSDALREAYGR
ncbi:MAG: hypothetical protein RJA22_2980 [Verrucomicrobiota bacterium]|jgi:nucleoside-diphosphate-sugar epimerase